VPGTWRARSVTKAAVRLTSTEVQPSLQLQSGMAESGVQENDMQVHSELSEDLPALSQLRIGTAGSETPCWTG
jgi:hypothetical protein